MIWSAAGSLALALAVMLGAFGAHALKGRLDAYSAGIWEKAIFYHFIHALGILIVSLLPKTTGLSHSSANTICALLGAGILLFSGSLYLLALTGTRALGAITPFGGVSFIAGWLALSWVFLRR
jgi:uncharacterized membrane protein YgdD (TMEM256/DUF423 family)